MTDRPPPIDEAVGLLDRHQADVLESLRQELPDLASELKRGVIAGPADRRVLERSRVHVSALQVAIQRCRENAIAAKARLSKSRRMRLAGSVSATIGSAGVLASLATTWPAATFITGSLALAGSLASLGSDHIQKVGGRDDIDVFDLYIQISDGRFEAESLRNEFNIIMNNDPQDSDEDVLADLCKKSNTLCQKVNKWDTILA